MTKHDDGGPAYPRTGRTNKSGHRVVDAHDAMSLRDWFAGQVDPKDVEFHSLETAAEWLGCATPDPDDYKAVIDFACRVEAAIRYQKADAMLAERSKRND